MKPPTRKKVASRPKDLPIEEYSHWKLGERRQLLQALEKYSVNQIPEITAMVETKSEVEVKYYLSKLKRSLKTDTSAATSSEHRKYIRNIQAWIRFTHQLVDDEEQTYSSMIGKLLALYGQNCFKKIHLEGVDFRLIYEYLAGLCIGVQFHPLPPLESAIVLDLLKNVATTLGKYDTTQHKEFVLMNFQKQMFPECNLPSRRNLFAEVKAPPGSLLSSLPSSSKTAVARKRKENISSSDSDASTVSTDDSPLQKQKTRQDTWYKTAKVPQQSQTKRKFPADSSTESADNSSPSKAKMSKHLPGISVHDTQNEFSGEIPSTSQIEHLECQQSSDETFLTSKNIKQEFRSVYLQTEENDMSDSSLDQEADIARVVNDIVRQGDDCSSVRLEMDDSDTNKEVTSRQTEITLVTNTGEQSPQVPTESTVSHLPNENMAMKTMDNTDDTNIAIQKKQSGNTLQKESILSTILWSPAEGSIVKETPNKISNNPTNPDSQVSQLPTKTSLLSHLFHCPIENVCPQKAESFQNAQKNVDNLNLSVQENSDNLEVPIVDTANIEVNRLLESSVKGSMASQPTEKQLCDTTVDTELTDSADEADKFTYKPSISWLNPMNIPAHLINLTIRKRN